jgi:hypothetical protein
MTGAIVWKEYRDGRAVWVALAALGAMLLGLVVYRAHPQRVGETEQISGVFLAAIMAWTQGMVTGGMLIAGETEAGTQVFLNGLPGSRRRVWWTKVCVGLGLVLLQAVWLVILGVVLGLFTWERQTVEPLIVFGGVILAGLVGLAWGLFGARYARTVLGVFAVGIPFQFLVVVGSWMAMFAYFWLVNTLIGSTGWPERHPALLVIPLVVIGSGLGLVLPLVVSYYSYTRADRRGRTVTLLEEAPLPARWRSMVWLVGRQLGWLLVTVVAIAPILGMLVPGGGPFLWAIGSLMLGTLCGGAVYLDEQQNRSACFLGEQRFPLGAFWLCKVGNALVVLVVGTLLLLVTAIIAHRIRHPNQLPMHELMENGVFLTLWPLVGFAVGQLFSVLVRNPVVAIVATFGLAGMLAAMWLPSLVVGGVAFWTVLPVPMVLLLTGRWLLGPWTQDRLASWRVILGLVGIVGLCVLLTAGGLWYRVLEIPQVAEPAPLAEYLATLPTLEENEAGRLVRGACAKFREIIQKTPVKEAALHDIVQVGWKPGADLEIWLNSAFESKWDADLARAAELPTGVMVDPRRVTLLTPIPDVQVAREATDALIARGLQLQAKGDPAAFGRLMREGLALGRNLRFRTIAVSTLVSWVVETSWMQGVERWLERLEGHPELLREALGLVRKQAELSDPTEEDLRWADSVFLLNTVEERPEQFLNQARRHDVDGLWRFSVAVPWERERFFRIARVIAWGTAEQGREMEELLGWPQLTVDRWHRKSDQRERFARTRATVLMLALRLYQAEQGKPASTLDALVPRYLPAVPLDPYDNKPFRYRISAGERIDWITPPSNEIKERVLTPGQGVLWSVGPDGVDNGGKRAVVKFIMAPGAPGAPPAGGVAPPAGGPAPGAPPAGGPAAPGAPPAGAAPPAAPGPRPGAPGAPPGPDEGIDLLFIVPVPPGR